MQHIETPSQPSGGDIGVNVTLAGLHYTDSLGCMLYRRLRQIKRSSDAAVYFAVVYCRKQRVRY
jgi:hypothetical protein